MKISLEELKTRYQSHIRSKSALSRERCPSPESIYNVFEVSTSRRKKDRIVSHLTECPYCLDEFRFFLEVYRSGQKTVQEIHDFFAPEKHALVNSGKKPSLFRLLRFDKSRRRLYWKIAAVSAVLLISLSIFYLADKFSILGMRHEERGARGQIQLLSPIQQEVARDSLIFRWEPLASADYYVLEVFDESLRSIWKSPKLSSNSLLVPSASLEKMRNDRVYFWMVTAVSRERTKTESPLEEFTLKK